MVLLLVKILTIQYPTTTYNEHPDIIARTIKSYKPDGITFAAYFSSGKQAINSIEKNTWIKADLLWELYT